MQRLGKNHGGYHGETIDIRAVLPDIKLAAQQQGWTVETYGQQGEFELFALRRAAAFTSHRTFRLYLSAGIHGDEPAGPLSALRLLQENRWPEYLDLWFCPCLNPMGLMLNRRENAAGVDLNRDYRHPQTGEAAAHLRWLERQPDFNVTLCLHEDWESHGFYVYELNPDRHPPLAGRMVKAVAQVCPIDLSPLIEGREASGGIISPNLDPASRPQWPEAFWLIQNKTRQSCTLEAPSDFPLNTRVEALVTGVNAALELPS
jgi:murein peptide amidase A